MLLAAGFLFFVLLCSFSCSWRVPPSQGFVCVQDSKSRWSFPNVRRLTSHTSRAAVLVYVVCWSIISCTQLCNKQHSKSAGRTYDTKTRRDGNSQTCRGKKNPHPQMGVPNAYVRPACFIYLLGYTEVLHSMLPSRPSQPIDRVFPGTASKSGKSA